MLANFEVGSFGLWLRGPEAQGPGSQREPLRECRGICGCARRAHQPRSKEETKLKETPKNRSQEQFFVVHSEGNFPWDPHGRCGPRGTRRSLSHKTKGWGGETETHFLSEMLAPGRPAEAKRVFFSLPTITSRWAFPALTVSLPVLGQGLA